MMMGFYLRTGIGPLRYSTRLGGRGKSSAEAGGCARIVGPFVGIVLFFGWPWLLHPPWRYAVVGIWYGLMLAFIVYLFIPRRDINRQADKLGSKKLADRTTRYVQTGRLAQAPPVYHATAAIAFSQMPPDVRARARASAGPAPKGWHWTDTDQLERDELPIKQHGHLGIRLDCHRLCGRRGAYAG